MKRGQLILLVGLIAVAAAALFFNAEIARFLHSSGVLATRPARTQPGVAVLAQVNGHAGVRYFQTNEFEDVTQAPLDLRLGDTLKVAPGGQARLNFNSGYSIEIEGDSQVTFEKQINGEALVLNLVQGAIQVLQEARSDQQGQLLVLENGFLREPMGRNPKEPLRVQSGQPDSTSATPPPQEPENQAAQDATDESGSLSTDYIVSIIQCQKAFFNRCYANHLQANPYSKGTMNYSFTIEPTGRVKDVKVLSTTIKDETLQKCVSTVIERCRFRAFEAKPIIANYPLVFE